MKKIVKNASIIILFTSCAALFLITADDWRASLNPICYFERSLATENPIVKTLFSPDDGIKDIQIDLIEHEQESLDIAIFSFTDQDTAQAIIDAHKRGVKVRVVSDRGSSVGEYSKIFMIRRSGIPVYICPKAIEKQTDFDETKFDDKAVSSPLMHNKFIIFGKTVHNKQLLWTGSFNFTRSANAKNQENVIIISDTAAILSYKNQFEKLIERSELL